MDRKVFRSALLLVLFVLFSFTACRGPSPIKDVEGSKVYTQIGMWVDGNALETTNYSRGWFLPVNTRVKIENTTARTIRVHVPSRGQSFVIKNRQNYTGKNIEGIYNQYFGDEKVSLKKFDKDVRENIKSGNLEKGMSKKATILARGYPPVHRTSSLESNVWTYWKGRFTGRIKVHFKKEKISRIEE